MRDFCHYFNYLCPETVFLFYSILLNTKCLMNRNQQREAKREKEKKRPSERIIQHNRRSIQAELMRRQN